MEASKVVLPNVRSSECTIHQTKSGTYALVPTIKLNPSVLSAPVKLSSDKHGDAKYLRYWRMTQKPHGGKKLRDVDVRIGNKR